MENKTWIKLGKVAEEVVCWCVALSVFAGIGWIIFH